MRSVSTSTCPFDDRYHVQASQNMHNNDRVSFRGGGGGGEHSPPPPLEAGCPPLRGPQVTYSYSITFDIVHVESFPLLMAKAVLNECFALLRAPRRQKQSLSLSVLFFLLFVFQYICTGTLHTLCSRFKSVNRSRFPLYWLSFSC